MKFIYKFFSYILTFPMLLYIIEEGIFESTLYVRTYIVMLIVLFIIIFLYIIMYIIILRKYKLIKEIVEGNNT